MLNTDSNIAYVKPVPRLSYFTEVCEHSSVRINGITYEHSTELLFGDDKSRREIVNLKWGPVTIMRSVYAYNKVDKKSGLAIDKIETIQPTHEYDTVAIWSDIPVSVQVGYLKNKKEFSNSRKKKKTEEHKVTDEYDKGALHAIEHVLCSLAPALISCDSRDLSCQHTRRHGDANRYYLLLYETSKSGLGLSEKLQHNWFKLLEMSRDLIQNCHCCNGCPSVSLQYFAY